jgi:monoamine oxidase
MFMPALGKGIGIYKTPFWRSTEKLSAQVISDRGASRVTFDSTPEDGAFGAILGFILGDDMRAVDKLSPAQAQKQVVGDFTRYFGDKAKDVSEFVLVRWDLEEFSKGGPTAAAPPGVLSVVGDALRQKVGGIHFAGTETSEFWTGYMDGAIRSGERAAREIVGR